jgi:hypothetical protein
MKRLASATSQRRCLQAALALALCCLCGAELRGQPEAASLRPEGPALSPWRPWESYPGGDQADERLDRAVEFWGAGIPLKDVFAEVAEQTGVEIGFWPPGDENERICVTLYLNPEGPPTLREVMAQLSWVLDCSFACSAGDGDMTYSLLSTSVGHGVIESLRQRRARRDEEDSQKRRETAAEARARILPALDECLAAADLPQAELVERYRGINDVMLATLLDPGKRGLIDFLRSVPRELLDEIPLEWHEGIELDWWELTPEQRDMLREAVPDAWRPMSRWTEESMRDSTERSQREIHVSIALYPCRAGQGLAVGLSVMDPASGRGEGIERELPLLSSRGTTASEAAELRVRQLLGEDITDEEIGRAREAYHAQRREKRERAWRPRAEALLAEHRMLSEGAEARLGSLTMPLSPETACSLWQAQEAVARLSGYHIVSDCFWQPARALGDMLAKLPWRDDSRMTALDVLTLRCATCCGKEDPWPMEDGVWSPTSEWGDVGGFLRFRTLARDVCRGAFLPAETLELAGQWLQGPLAEVAESDEPTPPIRVPVDVRDLVWLRAELGEAQWRWGGELIYGDPADRGNAYRHAFLARLLRTVREDSDFLWILGQLDDEQWQRLTGEGLHDLEIRRGSNRRPIRFDLLRLVPPGRPPPDVVPLLRANQGDPSADLMLDDPRWQEVTTLLSGRGKQVGLSMLPAILTIEPPSTAALLESPRPER